MSSASDTKIRRPSLVQLFNAPDDFVGEFGWLCGFSADALFLNDAAERFTRRSLAQRAHSGRIALAVFLDPGNPAITILDTPGVAHLPILDIKNKPFRLLHAKVALLGFKQINGDKWCIRLIVTTGNWTRQTIEESLDLAWHVDVSSKFNDDDNINQNLADIKAAYELMKWIVKLFDTRLLDAIPSGQYNETKVAKNLVESWIRICCAKVSGKSRFFDNRDEPFLRQIPEMVKSVGNSVRRNYLAMGSGFYESVSDNTNSPQVPNSIIDSLKAKALLTDNPEIDLFVNPESCQSIAMSDKNLNKQGITIRPATPPCSVFGEETNRTLHAKFLFSANYRSNSNFCNSSWIYLGSGNLTRPGFAEKMNPHKGNLEVGVVFSPGTLYWEGGLEIEPESVITNLLPIQFKRTAKSELNQLSPGSEMETRETCFISSPVAWFSWWEEAGACELRTTDSIPEDYVVLDPAGDECVRTDTGFTWQGEQPRQVHCCWLIDGVQQQANIPVIDHYGRIGASKLLPISLEEA